MAMMEEVLKPARVGGFEQSDILVTLLSKNELNKRVMAMTVKACAAAGNEATGNIFGAMRRRGNHEN
jgi:hypothetical protein